MYTFNVNFSWNSCKEKLQPGVANRWQTGGGIYLSCFPPFPNSHWSGFKPQEARSPCLPAGPSVAAQIGQIPCSAIGSHHPINGGVTCHRRDTNQEIKKEVVKGIWENAQVSVLKTHTLWCDHKCSKKTYSGLKGQLTCLNISALFGCQRTKKCTALDLFLRVPALLKTMTTLKCNTSQRKVPT